jgi:aminoglycoside 6'-N-acetyltransferase
MATYAFRPLAENDLPLIERWLAVPHVAQWWDDGRQQLADIHSHIDDPAIEPFIVNAESQPIGYIHSYNPHAWPDHPYNDFPDGTRGFDQFIGEAEMTGKGHGTALTRAFVDRLFKSGAGCIVTDPDPANVRAVRVYEKAGFIAERAADTAWGHVLLMVRRA